jgi:hypothetical protein
MLSISRELRDFSCCQQTLSNITFNSKFWDGLQSIIYAVQAAVAPELISGLCEVGFVELLWLCGRDS